MQLSKPLNEQQLDPAVALAALDNAVPRDPSRQFALKHEDCFIVSDAHGDILGAGDGMFVDDTRVLSLLRLKLAGRTPSLLGSSLSQDNILFTANLSNGGPAGPIPASAIHVERRRFLWRDRLYERIKITNYGGRNLSVPIHMEFAADFRDMFEVRGSTRSKRGLSREVEASHRSVRFSYEGLDGLERVSVISFSEEPDRLSAESVEFVFDVAPRERKSLFLEVGTGHAEPTRERFRASAARARYAMRSKRRLGATLQSSGRVFNDWLVRARADLALLTTDLETGPYPYAGIPWYSTAFGRDGVISALQMLWLDPSLARGVLSFLAQHQATETSPFSDAEPGKVMHETRKGEMAALKELPFARYYGGVDTTPLYVFLATAYASRTGDLDFIGRLWPSLLAATSWIENVTARSPEGFLTYQRAANTGLANQGWKDSHDAVFHADGRIAAGPIALVEVQGYVFAALLGMARLARRRGEADRAADWEAQASRLRANVETRFWMEEAGYYAIALDGEGKQCAVRTSNAGHLLFVGLPSQERANRVIEHLLSAKLYSGWGVRTLAEDEVPFNPMSYHNGSIWPHDTAICAAGLARYGARDAVVKLTSGMFEAAVQFQMRLPELFCGFERFPGEAPISYPVACLPQAWSAAAPFMLLQSCIGIRIDGHTHEIAVDRPRLPIGIDSLTVRHLRVGDTSVDVHFQRVGNRIACYVDQRHEGLVPLTVRS